MRLHQLEMTAFGPFAGSVSVDFDSLSDAGLFLLTGDTGAGKSSILDAICFALYGQVPGDRHSARHLRSDLAEAGAAPQVILTLSLADRTLRFTRSPSWERAKKRTSGVTKVPAHILVEERTGDEWSTLTNRLDDAGLLVTDLLGMNCAQFTQVALLPQGRFQAFLRSTSKERHGVLQTLFRTSRFEQIERWLVDRRTALRQDSRRAHDRTAGLLNRLQEAAATPTPTDWDLLDLDRPATSGAVASWAADVVRSASALLEGAETQGRERRVSSESAASALEAAVASTDLRRRGEMAQRDMAVLAESLEERAALHDRLARHDSAAPVISLARRAAEARASVKAADSTLRSTEVGMEDDVLDEEVARATSALAIAEASLPRAATLEQLNAKCAVLAATTADLADRLAWRAHTDLSAEVQTLREFAELTGQVSLAKSQVSTARETAQTLREAYQDAREERINGMAAELATGLVSGCSCPVCGSKKHPALAATGSSAVARIDEERARERYEDAAFSVQTLEDDVAGLRTALATLTARVPSGCTLEQSERRLAEAPVPPRSFPGESRHLATLQMEHTRAVDDQHATTTRIDSLESELDELLQGQDASTVAELISLHQNRRELLEQARSARREHQLAVRAAEEAERLAQGTATDAGFTNLADAVACRLSEADASQARYRLTEGQRAESAARSVLDDPEVQAALAEPPPELALVRERHRVAADLLEAALVQRDAARRRSDRVIELRRNLDTALDAWKPLRADYALVAALSSLAEGKSVENHQRIRLSAYVLAERLRQVVAAANERLRRMSDHRYTLEQCDEKGAGEQRGGLSLRVRDDWSGKLRDPATLSGGETFVVSLALALGLADTVSNEAGGADLQTLFIDEGFGTLDPSTLDDVMDTLDTLRDGGRVVGIVSHVPELRSRVTTQLEVAKARTGSTLCPIHALA